MVRNRVTATNSRMVKFMTAAGFCHQEGRPVRGLPRSLSAVWTTGQSELGLAIGASALSSSGCCAHLLLHQTSFDQMGQGHYP